MKTILIRAEVPDEIDFDSFVDIKSRDGIITIENGKSIKAEIIEPPSEQEIRQTSGLLGSTATAKIWYSGAKWVLNRLGL